MRQYIRAGVAGSTYFFTVALEDRSAATLTKHVDILRKGVRDVRSRHPFHIDAMVILPDHIHALWTLPANDAAYPTRWMLIKGDFTRKLRRMHALGDEASRARGIRGERSLWQRRYWEHQIRDDGDFARHVDYIHFNPVKHGLVKRAADWSYSSFHRYVREGLLDIGWGVAADIPGSFGE